MRGVEMTNPQTLNKNQGLKQEKLARTFLPEILAPGTGLSPPTNRSVMPFNNVHTIEDVMKGRPYRVPGGGGSWSDLWGEDTWKSYREEGDDYKRQERDLSILQNMAKLEGNNEDVWKVRVPGGTRTFPNFSQMQRFRRRMLEKNQPIIWVTRVKKAASTRYAQAINAFDMASLMQATFAIDSTNVGDGVKEVGTCFCVSPGRFVTCAHAIKKFDQNNPPGLDFFESASIIRTYIKKGNNRYKAKLMAINANADIAILQCDIDCPVIQLEFDPKVGDEIMTIGTPFGYEGEASFGYVGSLERSFFARPEAPTYMFVDIDVHSGNSGGPIIDKQSGKAVGMIVSIIGNDGGPGLNAGLPAKYIEQYCKASGVELGV